MRGWSPGRLGVLFGALALAGCATNSAVEVNQAAQALRTSYSDDTSRMLARQTIGRLGERTVDYRIGPGDVLEISIFEWELREQTKTAEFRVSESGVIALPVIGELKVRDKTVAQIKSEVEIVLREGGFIKQPRVSIDIAEFRSKRVAVVGAVNDPGVYTLRQNVTTLLDIVSLAGGLNDRAGGLLYVIRPTSAALPAKHTNGTKPAGPSGLPQGQAIRVDLYELLEKGDLSLNMVLGNGDVVNVPDAATFSVIGFVREPGAFALKKPTTVLEGVAMAQGLMEKEASPENCLLKRITPEGEVVMPLDLVAIARGANPNLYLQPQDIISVQQTPQHKAALDVLDFFKSVFNVGLGASYPLRR